MPIKTGQTVKVISGKDKGKVGKVTQVFPREQRVVVEGVNKMYKHLKQRAARSQQQQTQSQKGERVEFFGPIHLSNVVLTDEQAPAAKPKAKAKREKKAEPEAANTK